MTAHDEAVKAAAEALLLALGIHGEHISAFEHQAATAVAAAAPILAAEVEAEAQAWQARARRAEDEVDRLRVAVLGAYGMGRDDEAAGLPARTFRNVPPEADA